MLAISKRSHKRTTSTAEIRRWSTLDGRYAVDEIKSLLGLPRRCVAVQRLENGNELVISRHRKKSATVKFLERHTRMLAKSQRRLFK